MAASRLQPEPASRARLEDELSKLSAQQLAAGRMLRDSQGAAPHGGAEPLDQPRLPDDQAIAALPSGESAAIADRPKTRRSSSATCGSIRANCWRNGACGRRSAARDGEPARLDVEEHERTVVTTAGEIEAGDKHHRQVLSTAPAWAELGAAFRHNNKDHSKSTIYVESLDPSPSANPSY